MCVSSPVLPVSPQKLPARDCGGPGALQVIRPVESEVQRPSPAPAHARGRACRAARALPPPCPVYPSSPKLTSLIMVLAGDTEVCSDEA